MNFLSRVDSLIVCGPQVILLFTARDFSSQPYLKKLDANKLLLVQSAFFSLLGLVGLFSITFKHLRSEEEH